MTPWLNDLLMIFIAGLLVLINGFIVGAEFALVKIRESRVDERGCFPIFIRRIRDFSDHSWVKVSRMKGVPSGRYEAE